jgi:hypothetical protein
LKKQTLQSRKMTKSLKYIQTNEYSDNKDGYVNTRRIVHLYELEHEEKPINTEPQNHQEWEKFILGEAMKKETIDSIQRYTEHIFYKSQYGYMKTPQQCIHDAEQKMTEEMIKEKEKEHPNFFLIRIVNQILEISYIDTKNFKYENSEENDISYNI